MYLPQSWEYSKDLMLAITMYLQLYFSMTMIKYQYLWKIMLEKKPPSFLRDFQKFMNLV